MNTEQLQVDFPEIQAAIYRVALSLDSFLVNGIQYGVLARVAPDGFIRKVAENLLRDLAGLEEKAPSAAADQAKAAELLAVLRAQCQQLVELVTGLTTFRTLTLPQLRSTVSQIVSLQEECVRLIQALEVCLRTPKPFYPSRPSHSTAAVNAFLKDLERVLSEEWAAAQANGGAH